MNDEKQCPARSSPAKARQAVNSAIANLSTCGASVQNLIAAILELRASDGSEEPTPRDNLLRGKVDDLKNLSVLCDNGVKRLSRLATKLSDDCSQQEVFAEVTGISRFISDQLQSEKVDIRRVLSTMT